MDALISETASAGLVVLPEGYFQKKKESAFSTGEKRGKNGFRTEYQPSYKESYKTE